MISGKFSKSNSRRISIYYFQDTNCKSSWSRVPNMIVKVVATKRPKLLFSLLKTCFTEETFSNAWKMTKSVLLRKGDKPLVQPSFHRSNCLWNTIDKLFRWILKLRLEAHLEQRNSLSNNQYEFRNKKSTVDTISNVMETLTWQRWSRFTGETFVSWCH